MAGGEIVCGSFAGKPESGSALPGVLDALAKRTDGKVKETIKRLKKPFGRKDWPDHIEINKRDAAVLRPLLDEYKKDLVRIIGHSDWSKANEEEEAAGLDTTDAQYGKGKGWQLYCVKDLMSACRVAAAENEAIHIVFV